MPNRILRDGILTSEDVDKLGPVAEVFYRRLMSVVDDFGRFTAHPGILRAACYPLRVDKVREADISRLLAEVQDAGLIVLYAVDGKQYLQMHKTDKPRATKSKYPAFCAHVQTSEIICAHVQTNAPYSYSVSDSYSSADSDSISGGITPGDKKTFLTGPSEDFDKWWNTYPCRSAKADAWKAWQAAVVTIASERGIDDAAAIAWLLGRTRDYRDSAAGRDPVSGGDFRPAPARWLASGKYDDDLKEWAKPNGDVPKATKQKPTMKPLAGVNIDD